ncbi:MAG: amidohydrolase family protein [Acidimicrobiales bacterium]
MSELEERLLVVSSDGHVGPPAESYREYVDPRHLGAFDEWLLHYVPQWLATEEKDPEIPVTWSEEFKKHWLEQDEVRWGIVGKWDARRRLEALDTDGVAVDLLFPDDQSGNSPPFIGLARDFDRPWDSEYPTELKLAGARAYNRWLAEFCSEAPERLLGISLIGALGDVDAAIEEVRWAKENGINGGALLPVFYYNTSEPFWNDRRYDPLWEACSDLGVPLHTHVGPGSPNYGQGPEAPLLYAYESTYWPHRPLWFLILSGVLERHPELRLIFTEQPPVTWVIEALAMMDGHVQNPTFASAAHEVLTQKPSDYFHRQVWIGATLLSRPELELRHAIGVKKLMWGSDFPHLESHWPHARERLRDLMKGLPEEEVLAMIGGNAVDAYNLDVDSLRPVVESIGPLRGQVLTA